MDKLPVLVVDDEAAVHGLLQDALEDAGFSVTISGGARQAIELLERPDAGYVALVTDIRLGRGLPMGWDVARRARELEPSMPVVYMTGDGASDWASLGVPNSILVTKPFAPAQVVAAVSQLLNLAAPPPV